MGEYTSSAGNSLDNLFKSLQPLNDIAEQKSKEKLLAQQQAGQGQLLQQKADLAKQEQERNINTLQDLLGKSTPGHKMNFKVGDVSGGESDENPLKYAFQDQKLQGKALSHAYDIYAKGLPDLNKKIQASSEGLDIINDPSQIGALGQARSLMLRSMGMNRYNEQEASKSLPPSLFGTVKQMFQGAEGWSGNPTDANKFGDVNPMNALQKKAADSFFRGNLKSAQDQHQLLKKTALGSYQQSGFYDPARAVDFQATVGKDLDDSLNKRLMPGPNAQVSNQQSQLPKTPQPQQPSGPLDKLKSMFSMGGASQPQQPTTIRVKHKASGQTGTIPANEFDPNTYEQVQ